jgi:hypothetical protein
MKRLVLPIVLFGALLPLDRAAAQATPEQIAQARKLAAEAGRKPFEPPRLVAISLAPRPSLDPATGKTEVRRVFFQAEPIRLSLSVRSPAAIDAVQRAMNMGQRGVTAAPVHVAPQGRGWGDFVTTRFYRKDAASQEILRGFNWRAAVLRPLAQSTAFTDIAGNRASVPVLLPPEATASLPPGTYAAEATFDNTAVHPAAVTWRGRVRSEPFVFEVRIPKEPQERARVLVEQARYAADWGDWAAAEKLGEQAVKLAPNDSRAWSQLGQACGANRNGERALVAYEMALSLAGPREGGDPRHSLLEKSIAEIKTKLGR